MHTCIHTPNKPTPSSIPPDFVLAPRKKVSNNLQAQSYTHRYSTAHSEKYSEEPTSNKRVRQYLLAFFQWLEGLFVFIHSTLNIHPRSRNPILRLISSNSLVFETFSDPHKGLQRKPIVLMNLLLSGRIHQRGILVSSLLLL